MHWGPAEGVLWKAELPGRGLSQPIVWGERVFVTAAEGAGQEDQLHILALDRRTGRTLWHERLWGSMPADPSAHGGEKASTAAATPVTDGERLYAFFGTGDLFCLDVDGNLLWQRSLADEYGPFEERFGLASSPILYGDTVIVQISHWGPSYLLAVDKRTGRNRWKTDRVPYVSWSTPVLVPAGEQHEVVVCAGEKACGYDADSGRELWVVRGMEWAIIPTPVAGNGLVYAVAGRKGYTLAIRPGGRGDVTGTHVEWRTRRGSPYVPSPLLYGDHYYLVDDGGIATCLDASNGQVLWQARLRGAYSASPVASADGLLYFTNEEGQTTVLKAGAKHEPIAVNSIEEPVIASPALSAGQILLRGAKHLYAIGPGA